MKILVLNSGSSSIKFQLFDMQNEATIASGLIEKIGQLNSCAKLKVIKSGEIFEKNVAINDHRAGLEIMDELFKISNTLHNFAELDGVGHRVVHGGDFFNESTLVTDEVIEQIKQNSSLAPLHNPGHLAGIKNAMQKSGTGVKHVVVFDTTFHKTMPEYVYHYALPFDLCKRLHIRKYGFHGISHNYVTKKAAAMLGIAYENFNAISLHLGNGASICAVKGGKSIDTSMGLSPLEGLIMGSRSGDIDPAVITYLLNLGEIKPEQIDELLNKKSGLLGICGSSDMRDVVDKMHAADQRAKLAFDMFCYRVKKYIGAYSAVLGRVNALIFTGGIGENAPNSRSKICGDLAVLGINIDDELNYAKSCEPRCIDAKGAVINTLVIPTNEELEIALETKRLICS